MITFDPRGMTAPLKTVAEAVMQNAGADASLVRVAFGHRTATVASGYSDPVAGVAATPIQSFDAGSHAKMMTAVVVLQLVEQGLIDLNARAADYLPAGIVAGIPNADLATVRQLLNMTSGIPNYTDALDEATGLPVFFLALDADRDRIFTADDALEIARGMAANHAPGEEFYYTNTAYTLLGKLVTAVTGRSLADEYDARIFGPLGLSHTSGQIGGAAPDRLGSFQFNPLTGQIENAVEAESRWHVPGEGSVVTSTADLISFMQALLVDRTLLGPAALAEMLDFHVTESVPGFGASLFGLGIARTTLEAGLEITGFIGGTIGTGSSTFLETASGAIVSIAGTTEDAGEYGSAETICLVGALLEDPAWAPTSGLGGPVRVASVSAAQLDFEEGRDGLTFAAEGATLTLDRALGSLTTRNLTFVDGSVLVVGDNRPGVRGDDRGNVIDILRHHAGAANADNQLIGLGGSDKLAGGRGADRILGGDGDDRLFGRAGDDKLFGGRGRDMLHGGDGDDLLDGGAGADRLYGGRGDDVLVGGRGADILVGGGGADRFVFRSVADNRACDPDIIRDFTRGEDRIDLSAIDAVRGGADDAFSWIGKADFGCVAGQLRFVQSRHGGALEGDVNGDGCADFRIVLRDVDDLSVSDFLL